MTVAPVPVYLGNKHIIIQVFVVLFCFFLSQLTSKLFYTLDKGHYYSNPPAAAAPMNRGATQTVRLLPGMTFM